MANKNGMGPDEKGPRTGRQMGNCGNRKPNEESRRGLGRGLRRRAQNNQDA